MTLKTPQAREQISGWIEHDGTGLPVAIDALVKVRQRDGWVSPNYLRAGLWSAGHDNWQRGKRRKMYDIVEYRLHTPASSSEDQP